MKGNREIYWVKSRNLGSKYKRKEGIGGLYFGFNSKMPMNGHYYKDGRGELELVGTKKEEEIELCSETDFSSAGSEFSGWNNRFIKRAIVKHVVHGHQLTVIKYNALISVLCRNGKIGVSFIVKDEMVRKSFRPDLFTYNTLMNGLCKLGDMEGANELLKDVFQMGLCFDCVMYNILMDR